MLWQSTVKCPAVGARSKRSLRVLCITMAVFYVWWLLDVEGWNLFARFFVSPCNKCVFSVNTPVREQKLKLHNTPVENGLTWVRTQILKTLQTLNPSWLSRCRILYLVETKEFVTWDSHIQAYMCTLCVSCIPVFVVVFDIRGTTFCQHIQTSGNQVGKRVWPLAVSGWCNSVVKSAINRLRRDMFHIVWSHLMSAWKFWFWSMCENVGRLYLGLSCD